MRRAPSRSGSLENGRIFGTEKKIFPAFFDCCCSGSDAGTSANHREPPTAQLDRRGAATAATEKNAWSLRRRGEARVAEKLAVRGAEQKGLRAVESR